MILRAIGAEGEILTRQPLVFDDAAARAEVAIDLPLEMRNQIARLELEPSAGVGGVVLLDERWRHRLVGLVGEPATQAAQPLLSELYYVERALGPHAELRRGSIAELLAAGVPAIVLTDGAQIGPGARTQLASWIENGGVLLRFAGPRLANAEDDLVPVQLRRGDRNLGGALSWARPLPLTSFEDGSPLADIAVPEGDVVVQRQVLAQPGPQLAGHIWARLADGTPLITGAQRGKGWLVLVHTTANTTWSSLPLSGAFVEMLRRIAALAPGAGGSLRGPLAPLEVLDAAGHLGEPGPAAQPVPAAEFATTAASPRHPAGLYGPVDAAADAARQALNLASAVPDLQALRAADLPVCAAALRRLRRDRPDAVAAARGAAAGAGRHPDRPAAARSPGAAGARRPAAAGLILLLALLPAPAAPARADSEDAIVAATSETRLAYVLTGLPEVDQISQAGLEGLSLVLNRRTAVEAGEPRAVDLATDDLNLFPLLYWPIPDNHPQLAAGVPERLDAYLRQGGMILFDTSDASVMIPGQAGPGPGERRLQQLLAGLNLPPLEPVPEDHTLTRSFYLLQDFPGRWTGQTVWVDHAEPSVNDGVSSVIIGGNGWAGAWAIDDYGLAMFPVTPGGERQRELARRFGVNLVMYALTGNYKTDQVHIPALLERLGE